MLPKDREAQQCMYLACSYQSLVAQKVLDRILGVHMHGYVVCTLWGSPVDEHTLHTAVQGPVLLDPKGWAQHSQCHAFHLLYVVRVLMNEQSLQCTFHSSSTAAFTLVTIDL